MNIYINDQLTEIDPISITVADLLKMRDVKTDGTAVAINNRLVRNLKWDSTILNEGDRVTIISAAFGG